MHTSAFQTPDGTWHYRGFTIAVDLEGRYYLTAERGARLPLMPRHKNLAGALDEVDTIFDNRPNLNVDEWFDTLTTKA